MVIPRHPGRLNRPVLAVAASTHVSTVIPSTGSEQASYGCGGFVPRASHPTVTSDARLGRVLVAEHQVVSLSQGTTATRAASCRTMR
ncbi:MAG: hypothetical protein OEW09_05305, partial [Anaerolineae bacterium]|nr:hypothetical protein [Anaerolineae bacterium]